MCVPHVAWPDEDLGVLHGLGQATSFTPPFHVTQLGFSPPPTARTCVCIAAEFWPQAAEGPHHHSPTVFMLGLHLQPTQYNQLLQATSGMHPCSKAAARGPTEAGEVSIIAAM